MKLSRTVSYALQATLQLAQSKTGRPVPCRHIAAEGQMPERFLLQVLRGLVTHDILGSTRGVDGGYLLKRSPAEISLLEVIEAVEGPFGAAMAVHEGLHKESRTKLQCILKEVAELARRELRAVKLAHLLPEISE
jgi:Rrf2 family protein